MASEVSPELVRHASMTMYRTAGHEVPELWQLSSVLYWHAKAFTELSYTHPPLPPPPPTRPPPQQQQPEGVDQLPVSVLRFVVPGAVAAVVKFKHPLPVIRRVGKQCVNCHLQEAGTEVPP